MRKDVEPRLGEVAHGDEVAAEVRGEALDLREADGRVGDDVFSEHERQALSINCLSRQPRRAKGGTLITRRMEQLDWGVSAGAADGELRAGVRASVCGRRALRVRTVLAKCSAPPSAMSSRSTDVSTT